MALARLLHRSLSVLKVDCAACDHVALLTPEFLLGLGRPKVLDLKLRIRCRDAEHEVGRSFDQVGASERLTFATRDNQHAPTCGAQRARLWQHSGSQRSGAPDRCPEPERQERDHDQSRPRVRPIIGGRLFERLGRPPPIGCGVNIVRSNVAVHQALHSGGHQLSKRSSFARDPPPSVSKKGTYESFSVGTRARGRF
jgi:hypothetical protein